jgi:hypothetical protein
MASADSFEQLLLNVREQRQLLSNDNEEATCQGVVLPILDALGWNSRNVREVLPQFAVETGRVDYCLKIKDRPRVFIEVKRPDQELEVHQRQLLDYAFKIGVKLAVLTNGFLWWFYLPLTEGSWEERRFFAIDIRQQEAHEAATHFREFLGHEGVGSGDADKRAQSVLQSKEREKEVAEALPRAWATLCEGPNEELMDLLDKTVESICGYRAQNQEILADFLAARAKGLVGPPVQVFPRKQRSLFPLGTALSDPVHASVGYQNRRPVAFRFQGQKIPVPTFIDILLKLTEMLHSSDPKAFEQVLKLRGTKRIYFSRDRLAMRLPKKIPGSDIYVEAHMSANSIVRLCRDILQLLNYPAGGFDVETAPRQEGEATS